MCEQKNPSGSYICVSKKGIQCNGDGGDYSVVQNGKLHKLGLNMRMQAESIVISIILVFFNKYFSTSTITTIFSVF